MLPKAFLQSETVARDDRSVRQYDVIVRIEKDGIVSNPNRPSIMDYSRHMSHSILVLTYRILTTKLVASFDSLGN